MAKQDTVTSTTVSKNNKDLRLSCIIGSVVMGLASFFFFSANNAESGTWAAIMTVSAVAIAIQIQVEWTSRSRG